MTAHLLDQWGRPVSRARLARPDGRAGVAGVRSPLTSYPGDGLDPLRLASILREADQGGPVRFLELAETIEERDAHYLGVLGTRRRSVAQIGVTVKPASDAPADRDRAKRVQDWLDLGILQGALFDILDAVGKGYSVARIRWDVSEGQWQPAELVPEDPRWFRFDRQTLRVPVEVMAGGQEEPLEPFRYVFAQMKAKSGLTLRSGLARVAAWAWMFKAYTSRDWQIFSQTYGQPLRVGKYGAGASERDRDTLFSAVANIAGDCAAIIPESMTIDFVETGNLGASADLYERRADWLDRQVSKAVLGNTTTTDSVAGGYATSSVHRLVQEDIERADALDLTTIVNRDVIVPWMQLEHGPLPAYPRVVIARPEAEDLKTFADSVTPFIDRGLRVGAREVLDKFGLSEPKAGDDVLTARAGPQAPAEGAADGAEAGAGGAPGQASRFKGVGGVLKRGEAAPGGERALHAEGPSTGLPGAGAEGADPAALLAERLAETADPAVARMVGQVEAMVEAAGSLGELREMIVAGFGDVDAGPLAEVLGQAMLAAHLGGRVAVLAEEE